MKFIVKFSKRYYIFNQRNGQEDELFENAIICATPGITRLCQQFDGIPFDPMCPLVEFHLQIRSSIRELLFLSCYD